MEELIGANKQLTWQECNHDGIRPCYYTTLSIYREAHRLTTNTFILYVKIHVGYCCSEMKGRDGPFKGALFRVAGSQTDLCINLTNQKALFTMSSF